MRVLVKKKKTICSELEKNNTKDTIKQALNYEIEFCV